jgi:hypothetical protein
MNFTLPLDQVRKTACFELIHFFRINDKQTETATTFTVTMSASFGDLVSFGDPSWYQGQFSPYYNDSHITWRKKV